MPVVTLEPEDIADLANATLAELDRFNLTSLMTDTQEFVALNEILKPKRVAFDSGKAISVNVAVKNSGAAHNTGLYDTDIVNREDKLVKGSVPWRQTTTNWGLDLREIDMNSGAAQIVDLVMVEREDSMTSLAELIETDFWNKPSSSSDKLQPFGVDYWIVYNATDGFTGGNPSGFSAGAAGIDSTDANYGRWKSYNATYTSVTKEDLIRKWRKAATLTNFKPPVPSSTPGQSGNYGYYTNYNVIAPLEEALESQNDNLGNDVASKDGMAHFRRIPVTYVPALASTNGDPVYGINWGTFQPVFLKNWYMKEHKVKPAANQRNVIQAHTDLVYNYRCRDRRRNFLLATADPQA